MTLNREENQIDLSIDEFEGIYDLFEHIDIYQAGITLLQTYIGMRKTPVELTIEEQNKKQPPKTNNSNFNGRSLFDQSDSKEYVKSSVPKWDQPATLEDLDKIMMEGDN